MMKTTFFKSYSFEFFLVGGIILAMLIPMFFITGLIDERNARKSNALYEISSKWGQAQTLIGPIIRIPFEEVVKEQNGKFRTFEGFFYVSPKTLNFDGAMATETRHRGIYEITLYKTAIKVSGTFPAQPFDLPEKNEVFLDRAEVIFALSDTKGIEKISPFKAGGRQHTFRPGGLEQNLSHGAVTLPIDLGVLDGGTGFEFSMNLNGTNRLYFVPLAENTSVQLTSSWPDPSFSGGFLPTGSDITPKGFSASWDVSSLRSGIPAVWEETTDIGIYYKAFGVDLYLMADIYQQTTRAAKYAILFISLTFASLLFLGIFTGKRIHPIQYGFTGLGLSIFYVLLLSFSEHIGFSASYGVSTLAVVSLITAYAWMIVGNKRAVSALTAVLSFLYLSLYFILQLEDYALLVGSIGLFLILAVIMVTTARIDWSRQRNT